MKSRYVASIAAGYISVVAAFIGFDAFDIGAVFASQTQKTTEAAPAASNVTPLDAERSLLDALNRKEKELNAREEEVVKKEERLNIVKADIEQRLSELKLEHEKIAVLVKKIDEIDDQRVKRIVKIYESMNPEEAASRIEKLEEDMAVMILSSMSERKAAKVLSFVNVSKSAKLSQSLRVKD